VVELNKIEDLSVMDLGKSDVFKAADIKKWQEQLSNSDPATLLSANKPDGLILEDPTTSALKELLGKIEFGPPEDGVIVGSNNEFSFLDRADDKITVEKVGDDLYTVRVNDEKVYYLSAEELANVTIDGGRGDDEIHVSSNVDVGLTILGGSGDDVIYGGSGDDHIDGGRGQDVIQGGDGADVLIGGAGADAIYAGSQATVYTNNVESTEEDHNDDLEDIVVAHESAQVSSGPNAAVVRITDQNIADAEAWLAEYGTFERAVGNSHQRTEASEGFSQRIVMDIASMLTTEQGQGLLDDVATELDAADTKLTFREQSLQSGGSYDIDENALRIGSKVGTYSDGSIQAPLTVVFHEMVHALQFLQDKVPDGATIYENGRSIPNIETAAAGIPWLDEAGKVHTQPDPDNPYSANQFREELGITPRTDYGGIGNPYGPSEPLGEPVSWRPENNEGIGDHDH
jgi:hypothetical protein